jgi:hypothetical protein
MLILALILAIPTYGLSLLAYAAWTFYKVHKGKLRQNDDLSLLQRAVVYVGTNHNGSNIGTSVTEISRGAILMEVMMSKLPRRDLKTSYSEPDNIEFDMQIRGKSYCVHVSREPGTKDGAILRVRIYEPWVEELLIWFTQMGWHRAVMSNFYLPSQASLVFGAAHAPERRPGQPSAVPSCIAKLTELRVFGLINRDITELPRSISKLEKLEELKLGGNHLTKLPREVCYLSQLKILTLWMNDLTELPEQIGDLRNLEGIDISWNCELRKLPDSIVELTSLKRLYMSDNEQLQLTRPQEEWVADLIANGAEVTMDPGKYQHLRTGRPNLPAELSGLHT